MASQIVATKNLKTQRILGGFLAVEVPAWTELTFAYHPRMIYLGMPAETVLLGTAGYLGFKKYRRKRDTHD